MLRPFAHSGQCDLLDEHGQNVLIHGERAGEWCRTAHIHEAGPADPQSLQRPVRFRPRPMRQQVRGAFSGDMGPERDLRAQCFFDLQEVPGLVGNGKPQGITGLEPHHGPEAAGHPDFVEVGATGPVQQR